VGQLLADTSNPDTLSAATKRDVARNPKDVINVLLKSLLLILFTFLPDGDTEISARRKLTLYFLMFAVELLNNDFTLAIQQHGKALTVYTTY